MSQIDSYLKKLQMRVLKQFFKESHVKYNSIILISGIFNLMKSHILAYGQLEKPHP